MKYPHGNPIGIKHPSAQWLGDEDGMLELCLEAEAGETHHDWFFCLGWLMKLGETHNNI